MVILALPGMAALRPLFAAIRAGKTIALASKEALVAAGHLIGPELEKSGARILPIDSEHSAIFRCLAPCDTFRRRGDVGKIWLTASGGPLWDADAERMKGATPADVLRHPIWKMGRKVSIDSATMANKGLEEMEAAWLYGLCPEEVGVLVQRESLVHGLVEFRDGTTLAALHPPSMEFPIAHCLNYPNCPPQPRPALDFSKISHLRFCPPNREKFPCLALAEAALRSGKSAPCDFNAADESAVAAFLAGRIPFPAIPEIIGEALSAGSPLELPSLEAVEARHGEICRRIGERLGGGI
jgi:1-deoxy-D-xylulose-5-phosphate reductoisomerase